MKQSLRPGYQDSRTRQFSCLLKLIVVSLLTDAVDLTVADIFLTVHTSVAYATVHIICLYTVESS